MSSEIYELMKRSDEGAVVEKAHRRPRFVEDCVREMIRGVVDGLPELGDDSFVSARQENLETIHQHNVVADRYGHARRAAPRARAPASTRRTTSRCATGSTAPRASAAGRSRTAARSRRRSPRPAPPRRRARSAGDTSLEPEEAVAHGVDQVVERVERARSPATATAGGRPSRRRRRGTRPAGSPGSSRTPTGPTTRRRSRRSRRTSRRSSAAARRAAISTSGSRTGTPVSGTRDREQPGADRERAHGAAEVEPEVDLPRRASATRARR